VPVKEDRNLLIGADAELASLDEQLRVEREQADVPLDLAAAREGSSAHDTTAEQVKTENGNAINHRTVPTPTPPQEIPPQASSLEALQARYFQMAEELEAKVHGMGVCTEDSQDPRATDNLAAAVAGKSHSNDSTRE